MTDDYENKSFRLDPEARSFRVTGFRLRDLPALLGLVLLAVCLFTGFNIIAFAGLSFLSPDMQRVVWGLLMGLGAGYLVGVWVGGRRGRTDIRQLPQLSDHVKELARDPDGFIAAIKACREETGTGLREAKAAVEAYINQNKSG
jgi:hypothetical protein